MKPRNDHCFANVVQRGDLSTLTWMKGSVDVSALYDYVNIQYASINFRDVMLATGRLALEVFGTNRLQQECVLGFEFAGVNKRGQRVMGTVISGAMATCVCHRRTSQLIYPGAELFDLSISRFQIAPSDTLTWIIPDHWSVREASTCPVVYMTVYCAFFQYKPISKGRSILIHAGSGGIGLAAIRVALAYGLKVYTTVSTPEKKQFLLDTFPEVEGSYICLCPPQHFDGC